jgi:hypothetical protein
MLGLAAVLLMSTATAEPSVAAVVGVRRDASYSTVFLRLDASAGYLATVSRGLLVPSLTGLMFVDVVADCSHGDPQHSGSPQQYLSIHRVTGPVRPASCTPAPSPTEPPKTVKVLFVGHRYISVFRYSESWNGRGEWDADTRAWGQGTPIPMPRVLPVKVVADVDRWVAKQRDEGIAQALREGLTGDADPCLYPNASRNMWAITRAKRQWVVMPLLQSSCITYEEVTPIAVPDALVDGSRNQEPAIEVPTQAGSAADVVVSPDESLAVVLDNDSVQLTSVADGSLRDTLANATLPRRDGQSPATLVMVQWFTSNTLSRWRSRLEKALGDE